MNLTKVSNFQLDLTSDLQKWRTFLAIAELGSLTRAALYLDSNQSLLSRHLNALERDCNARLFTRTGRGVALSDFGQRLFPHVKSLLTGAEQLELEIRGQAREPAGRVTLGSLPSITSPIIGRLFRQLRANFPGIQLKILEGSSGQVEEWLADGRVDIAILYRYNNSSPTSRHHLATVESYLIGAKGDRLTSSPTVNFSELDGLPFILPGVPNGLRATLDALAKQEHIVLAPAIEADSLPLMRSVVAENRLYTVLPLHAVWSDIRDGHLQASRIVSPTVERYVSMELAKSKGPSRAVSAVSSEIVKIIEEGARSGLWNALP
ncbi:MAG: LysR family transcriptional regulator [Burkholderiaceae bacterium]|nr:LysR family transcriptional regulator [Burkholderiaceae bacterium]